MNLLWRTTKTNLRRIKMQALYDGDEYATISFHFDHGKVPDILVRDMTLDNPSKTGVQREFSFGKVKIQVFEREDK